MNKCNNKSRWVHPSAFIVVTVALLYRIPMPTTTPAINEISVNTATQRIMAETGIEVLSFILSLLPWLRSSASANMPIKPRSKVVGKSLDNAVRSM